MVSQNPHLFRKERAIGAAPLEFSVCLNHDLVRRISLVANVCSTRLCPIRWSTLVTISTDEVQRIVPHIRIRIPTLRIEWLEMRDLQVHVVGGFAIDAASGDRKRS